LTCGASDEAETANEAGQWLEMRSFFDPFTGVTGRFKLQGCLHFRTLNHPSRFGWFDD
jgi:hypothetical protein